MPVVGRSGFEVGLSEDKQAAQETMHRFASDVMRPLGRIIDRMPAEEVCLPGSPFWEYIMRTMSDFYLRNTGSSIRAASKGFVKTYLVMTAFCLISVVQADEPPRLPEKVFDDTCRFCHGHMIAPGIAVIRDIRGRNLPPELIKLYVRQGMGRMIPFADTAISDVELDALAKWIQASEAPEQPKDLAGQRP